MTALRERNVVSWLLRLVLGLLVIGLAALAVTRIAHGQATCTSARTTNTAAEASVIQQINQLRQQHGLRALTPTPALTRAADSHSLQMAASGVFAHDSLAVTQARFQNCGNPAPPLDEAIAGGNSDPTATFNQWVNSPPHLEIMLDSSMVAMGVAQEVGIYVAGGQTYQGFSMWTLAESASLDSGQPAPQPTPAPQPVPQSMVCATALRAASIQVYPC